MPTTAEAVIVAGSGGYQQQQQIPPYIVPYHTDRRLMIGDFEDYIRLKSLKVERIQQGDRAYRCSKEIRRCAADLFAMLEYRMRVADNESLKFSYIEITDQLKWYCQRTVEKAARLLVVMGLIWEPRATTLNGQKCMLWRIPREAVQKNILAFAKEQDSLDGTQQQKDTPIGLGNQQGKRASKTPRRLNASGSGLPNHSPKNADSGSPQPTHCDLSQSNDSTSEHDVSRVLAKSGTPITYRVRDGEPLAGVDSASIIATVRDAPLRETSNGESITHDSRDGSRTGYVMDHAPDTRSVPNKNLELLRNESNLKLDSDSDFEEKRATPEEQSVSGTRWCRQTIETCIWHWCPRPPEKPLSKAEHRRIDTQVSIVELQGRGMGVSDEETLRRLNYVLEFLTTESRFAVQAIPFCIGKATNKTSKEDYFLFIDTWRDLEQKKRTYSWQPASVRKQEEDDLITQIERQACMHAALKFLKAEGVSAEGRAYEDLVQLGAQVRRAQREEWEQHEPHGDTAADGILVSLPVRTQPTQQAAERYTEPLTAASEDSEDDDAMQGMSANEANQLIEDIKHQLPLAILDVHRLTNGSYVVLHAYSASEVIQYWRPDDWPHVFEARKEQTRQRVAAIRQCLTETSRRVEERQEHSRMKHARGVQTTSTYRSIYSPAPAPCRSK